MNLVRALLRLVAAPVEALWREFKRLEWEARQDFERWEEQFRRENEDRKDQDA